MSTTRLQFANALLPAIQAPSTADAVKVIVAWQMMEGQQANENDPLAHINEHLPKGESDHFWFPSIDEALAVTASSLKPPNHYAAIGDAFRAGSNATTLIAAIQRAAWCVAATGGPCPGYGAGIQSNYNRLADPVVLAREGGTLVGTTTLSGGAGATAPTGTSGTTSTPAQTVGLGLPSIPNPLGGITGTLGNVDKAFSHLVDPSWWKRVGVFALGGALAFYGLKMLKPDVADALSNGASSVRAAASSGPGVTTTPAKAGGGGKSIVAAAVEDAATAAAVA